MARDEHHPDLLTSGLDEVQGYSPPPAPVCSMHEKMECLLFGSKGALRGVFQYPYPL